MKYFSIVVILIASLSSCDHDKTNTMNSKLEESKSNTNSSSIKQIEFDSVKAKLYGADKYGMRPYVMAFLKAGPNRPKDSILIEKLQNAHLENINRLANEGKLVLAGPFYGDEVGDLKGIYIFDTPSIDSAKKYTESDPAIQQGSLVMELKMWYGSAALKAINGIHKEIAEIEI